MSIVFIENLKKNNYKAYKTLVEFSASTFLYELSDSGLWALNYYLKRNGINVNYSELTRTIPQTQWGVHPSKIQQYVYDYDKKFCTFEINNIAYYNSLKYPVIAFMNKTGNIAYKYTIIEGIKDDILQIKILENKDIIEVPAKIFNDQASSIILSSELN